MLDMYHRVFDRREAMAGEHVWNFANSQALIGIRRKNGNIKEGILQGIGSLRRLLMRCRRSGRPRNRSLLSAGFDARGACPDKAPPGATYPPKTYNNFVHKATPVTIGTMARSPASGFVEVVGIFLWKKMSARKHQTSQDPFCHCLIGRLGRIRFHLRCLLTLA